MYGILIVDDNSLVRMSLVSLINWKRHNATLVAIAHDGNEAFRLCEEHLPHIVITDIKMPGCDGITLMKKIRRDYPMIQMKRWRPFGSSDWHPRPKQQMDMQRFLTALLR